MWHMNFPCEPPHEAYASPVGADPCGICISRTGHAMRHMHFPYPQVSAEDGGGLARIYYGSVVGLLANERTNMPPDLPGGPCLRAPRHSMATDVEESFVVLERAGDGGMHSPITGAGSPITGAGSGAVEVRARCASSYRASSALLCDLLDAPTALAACCGFDLCHKYILYFYLCAYVFTVWAARWALSYPRAQGTAAPRGLARYLRPVMLADGRRALPRVRGCVLWRCVRV